MRSLKLTLAYDGTAYAGWQIQPNQKTIQGALQQALQRITGEHVRAVARGATDAGVHALGQVVSCTTGSRLSPSQMQRALNANLPGDIRILVVEEAPNGFHAIRDARGKRYRYVIQDGQVPDVFLRHYSWFVRGNLDETVMHRAVQHLVGTHDFSSFQASGSERESAVRTIFELTVARSDQQREHLVLVEIEASGFLYNMARIIVGTLVEVGQGRRAEIWPAEVLSARDRRQAGRTAPARGLYLVRVHYARTTTFQREHPVATLTE